MLHVTQALKEAREWPLVVASARLDRGRRAVESRTQLTAADTRLLWLLVSEGPQTMKEISDGLVLEQSTVSRQVNAALERDLVVRETRSGTAARVLRATDRGSDLFAAEVNRGMRALGQGLDAVPEAEQARFVELLLTFSDAYRSAADLVSAADTA